jgi:nucleotide-binding universal stress UspA family protein
MKLLLATDGSEFSNAAVREVIRRFPPKDTEVRIVHAVEWMKDMPLYAQFGQGPTAAHDAVEHRNRSFELAELLVAKTAEELEAAGFRTSVRTLDTDPAHAIIGSARDWGADLIVLGSHGRRGLERLILGSVADSVVRRAPCSVHVVRLPAAA